MQKNQCLCNTNLSLCKTYLSPLKLNQCSKETHRKQWVLIVFCDFILEITTNKWNAEELNKERKGNKLQAKGTNMIAETLINDTKGLVCFIPLLIFSKQELAFFTNILNKTLFINLKNIAYEKS